MPKFLFKNIEHKFLFCVSLFSVLVAICFYVYSVFSVSLSEGWNLGLLYFVPPLIAILIYHISTRFIEKNPLVTKILSAILNFIVIAGQILFSFIILIIIVFMENAKIYNDVKDYDKALNTISNQHKITHFPKTLPYNAKNAKLFKNAGVFFGSESILLLFEADKAYLDNEIKKNKYIKIKGPFSDDDYHACDVICTQELGGQRFNKKGFKFYIIGDNSTDGGRFRTERGIAVNYKTNQILYYFELTD